MFNNLYNYYSDPSPFSERKRSIAFFGLEKKEKRSIIFIQISTNCLLIVEGKQKLFLYRWRSLRHITIYMFGEIAILAKIRVENNI